MADRSSPKPANSTSSSQGQKNTIPLHSYLATQDKKPTFTLPAENCPSCNQHDPHRAASPYPSAQPTMLKDAYTRSVGPQHHNRGGGHDNSKEEEEDEEDQPREESSQDSNSNPDMDVGNCWTCGEKLIYTGLGPSRVECVSCWAPQPVDEWIVRR